MSCTSKTRETPQKISVRFTSEQNDTAGLCFPVTHRIRKSDSTSMQHTVSGFFRFLFGSIKIKSFKVGQKLFSSETQPRKLWALENVANRGFSSETIQLWRSSFRVWPTNHWFIRALISVETCCAVLNFQAGGSVHNNNGNATSKGHSAEPKQHSLKGHLGLILTRITFFCSGVLSRFFCLSLGSITCELKSQLKTLRLLFHEPHTPTLTKHGMSKRGCSSLRGQVFRSPR